MLSIVGGIVGLLGVAIYIIITKTVQGPLVESPLVVMHGQCSDETTDRPMLSSRKDPFQYVGV